MIAPVRRKLIGLSSVPNIVEDPVEAPEGVGVVTLAGEAISTSAVQLFFDDAVRSISHQYRINGGVPLPMPMDKAIRELASNTNYTFEVRGLNALGPGDWSNLITVKTWQEVNPTDIDNDGIPNINDPDHPLYDPDHPDSDPDGDGLKNKDDPDDDNDGTLDINDPGHPEYQPGHPDSPDYQLPADPLVATFSPQVQEFSGWGGSYSGQAVKLVRFKPSDLWCDRRDTALQLCLDGSQPAWAEHHQRLSGLYLGGYLGREPEWWCYQI